MEFTQNKLSHLCYIVLGRTPSRSNPSYWGQGATWVSISDLKEKYITKTKEQITKLGAIESNSRFIPEGTLLLSFKLSIGKRAFAGKDLYTNEAIAGLPIKNNTELDKEYLYYILGHIPLVGGNQAAMGQTLNKKSLSELVIPYPKSITYQKRIAKVLSDCEQLIQWRKESIQLLDDYLESTFLEMFGDPEINHLGWKTIGLESLCEKIVDCPHDTPQYSDTFTGFQCVRSSDIQNGKIVTSKMRHVSKDVYLERVKRHIPQPGEVIYIREGGRFGNAGRTPADPKICLGQRMMLFKANENVTTNNFIWALLNSKRIKNKVQKLSKGGAAPRVNISQLKKMQVFLPSLGLQKNFDTIVQKVDELQRDQTNSLSLLKELYNSLSQKAFKGELNLGEVEISDSDVVYVDNKNIIHGRKDFTVNKRGNTTDSPLDRNKVKQIQDATDLSVKELFLSGRSAEVNWTNYLGRKDFNLDDDPVNYLYALYYTFKEREFSFQEIEMKTAASLMLSTNIDYDWKPEEWKKKIFQYLTSKPPYLVQAFNEKEGRVKLKVNHEALTI